MNLQAMDSHLALGPAALRERLTRAVPDSWPPLSKAIALAEEKHAGQTRKDGSEFVTHPLRVALILLEVAEINSPDLLCAAVLHDVVEDSDLKVDDLRNDFGGKVADLVRAVTLSPLREGQSKSERERAHFGALSWEPRDAQILRSADRLDNLRTMGGSFRPERREEYIRDTREGLLPLTLACNTALYHALSHHLKAPETE